MGSPSAFLLSSGAVPPFLTHVHPCHSADFPAPSAPLPALPYSLRCAPQPIKGPLPSSSRHPSASCPSRSGSHLPPPALGCLPAAVQPSVPSFRLLPLSPRKRLYIRESRWKTTSPAGS